MNARLCPNRQFFGFFFFFPCNVEERKSKNACVSVALD